VVHELFATSGPQQEIAVFGSKKELFSRIDYYLAHDDERRAIAARARIKILEKHTYDHRIAEILKIINNKIPV
jgi:spore maturation protein CgeB